MTRDSPRSVAPPAVDVARYQERLSSASQISSAAPLRIGLNDDELLCVGKNSFGQTGYVWP